MAMTIRARCQRFWLRAWKMLIALSSGCRPHCGSDQQIAARASQVVGAGLLGSAAVAASKRRWLLAGLMFLLTALLWLILLGWIIHLWSIIDAAVYRPPEAYGSRYRAYGSYY